MLLILNNIFQNNAKHSEMNIKECFYHYWYFSSFHCCLLLDVYENGNDEMNDIINQLANAIAEVAVLMAKRSKQVTVTSRMIQTAVRILLTGEITKHAVSEGTKAVAKYSSGGPGSLDHKISRSRRAGAGAVGHGS